MWEEPIRRRQSLSSLSLNDFCPVSSVLSNFLTLLTVESSFSTFVSRAWNLWSSALIPERSACNKASILAIIISVSTLVEPVTASL